MSNEREQCGPICRCGSRNSMRGVLVVLREKIVYVAICLMPLQPQYRQARSSAGEHFLDAEGVGGSIPPVPTSVSIFLPHELLLCVSWLVQMRSDER